MKDDSGKIDVLAERVLDMLEAEPSGLGQRNILIAIFELLMGGALIAADQDTPEGRRLAIKEFREGLSKQLEVTLLESMGIRWIDN